MAGARGPAEELVLRPGPLAHPRCPGSVCEQRLPFPHEKWTGRHVGAGRVLGRAPRTPCRGEPSGHLAHLPPSSPQSCQADLVKDSGHKYFLSVLADPYMPVRPVLCGGRCVVGPVACSAAGTAWRAQGKCPPPSWGPRSGPHSCCSPHFTPAPFRQRVPSPLPSSSERAGSACVSQCPWWASAM